MHTRSYRPDDEDSVVGSMAEQPDFVETPTDRVMLRFDHCVQSLRTSNEESNSAIRRLNESMGYQRVSASHRVRRLL